MFSVIVKIKGLLKKLVFGTFSWVLPTFSGWRSAIILKIYSFANILRIFRTSLLDTKLQNSVFQNTSWDLLKYVRHSKINIPLFSNHQASKKSYDEVISLKSSLDPLLVWVITILQNNWFAVVITTIKLIQSLLWLLLVSV